MSEYFSKVKISNDGNKLSFEDSTGLPGSFTAALSANSHYTHAAFASCLLRDFTIDQLYDLVKQKGWELE